MILNRRSTLVISLLFITIISSILYVSIRQNESILFLEDLVAGHEKSRLKSHTPKPKQISINYEIKSNQYQADLYIPQESALASIVLIPGVAAQGKEDLRLVAFATTLARSRFMVLVPEISNLRELKIRAEDSRTIIDAFTYLISRPDIPVQGQAGIGAFSYAVGPAVLAALDPDVREKIDFILSVGGYYDVEQVITFFTTGYFKNDNGWQYIKPNEYGKWVFVLSNIERLSRQTDKEIFYAIAQRKMDNPNASIEDLTNNLSVEANSILALLKNQNYSETLTLITGIPNAIRADLNALNLSNKNLSQLNAKLILLHGIDDDIIPYTESILLSRAVAEGQSELFIVDGLAHVNVHPNLVNQWKLLRAIDALLDLRKDKLE
ncbi:MAG: alpha/beta hydrolase [Gammaproteobacteria bacterium]|nr:alpha/beta hydrolase [Gammaproteobacteria bacterium]